MQEKNQKIIYTILLILTFVLYFAIIILPTTYLLEILFGITFSEIAIYLYFIVLSIGTGYISKFSLSKLSASEETYLTISVIVSCILAVIGSFGVLITEMLKNLKTTLESIEANMPSMPGEKGMISVPDITINIYLLFLLSFLALNLPYFVLFTREKRRYLWYLIPLGIYSILAITFTYILNKQC